MNSEIEKLIALAVATGEITEKSKATILRKAQILGENLDEVTMLIDGEDAILKSNKKSNQIHSYNDQIETEMSDVQSTVKHKTIKEGDMKKCPSCGASVKSFSTICTDCGHEFRNTEATKSIKEFFIAINNAPLEKHAKIINNFPVPNTREDILEFLSMAIGNCASLTDKEKYNYLENSWTGAFRKELSYKEDEIRAWQSKVQAIIQKGKISFKDEFSLSIITNFENQFLLITKSNKQEEKSASRFFGRMSWGLIIICISIFLYSRHNHIQGVNKEKKRLEAIMDKVNNAISRNDYDAAFMLSTQMHWEHNDIYSPSDNKKYSKVWDEKRETIIEAIKSKRN